MAEHIPSQNEQEPDIRAYIKSAVNSLGPTVSKEEKKEHAKLLVKIFEQGMAPKDAMKISNDEIACLYSYAYQVFAKEQFKEAREYFKTLLKLDPFNSDFALALGITHHRLKDYEYALHCYMLSALLAQENPLPLFYAYDCFMNLKQDAAAAVMLSNAIVRSGDQPKYAKVKLDAQALFDQLHNKLVPQKTAKHPVEEEMKSLQG
jgi:type III secretion system low calcium response chaperone LcrH/SycD